MAIDPDSYSFAVYFVEKGNKLEIIVETPKGTILGEGIPMSKNALNNVNQLDTLQVSHDYDKSPCCVIWNGEKYCWC
jgi:hypothetical protein